MDRLPDEVHLEIRRLREQERRSWAEISQLSKLFVPWDSLPEDIVKLYPEHFLPENSLHRWYDLRVEQVEVQLKRQIAAAVADRVFEELPPNVRQSLGKNMVGAIGASQRIADPSGRTEPTEIEPIAPDSIEGQVVDALQRLGCNTRLAIEAVRSAAISRADSENLHGFEGLMRDALRWLRERGS